MNMPFYGTMTSKRYPLKVNQLLNSLNIIYARYDKYYFITKSFRQAGFRRGPGRRGAASCRLRWGCGGGRCPCARARGGDGGPRPPRKACSRRCSAAARVSAPSPPFRSPTVTIPSPSHHHTRTVLPAPSARC